MRILHKIEVNDIMMVSEIRDGFIEGFKEHEKCARSFLYFWINYCKIDDALKGEIGIEAWPHLLKLSKLMSEERLLLLLKSKQVGVSWYFAHYGLWKILFQEGANVLMMSKGEEEAKVLLGKAKFAYRKLPSFLAVKMGSDAQTEITIPLLGSRLKAFPSTEDAGIGEAASLVIADEWDYHPYASENYAAMKPTIDGGGQFIGLSTVNKRKLDTFFKRMWKGARAGTNGFYPFFIPYDVRTERTEGWRMQQEREYPEAWQIEEAYPRTEEEAMSPPEALGYFNTDALKRMHKGCREPIEKRGIVKIWKGPILGRKYICGVDYSEGEGRNNSSTQIIDSKTGELVANMASNRIAPDIYSYDTYLLAKEYNDALINPERNKMKYIILKLVEFGANVYYEDREKKKPGTLVTGSNKMMIMANMAESVRTNEVEIWDIDTVKEMYEFIRDGDKIHARTGARDDRVMAFAHGWYIRDKVKTGDYGIVQYAKWPGSSIHGERSRTIHGERRGS